MGGAAAGAAIGSAVPIVGTAVGGLAGGMIGALTAGFMGTSASKAAMDQVVEDDAKRMLALLQSVVEDLAGDFLLSDDEVAGLGEEIKAILTDTWLRSMYQAGSTADDDDGRRAYAYRIFDEICLTIVQKRPKIQLPSPEMVESGIKHFIDDWVTSQETSA